MFYLFFKISLILFTLIIIYLLARKRLDNIHFQKTMKPGQVCKYYKDLDGDYWIIEYLVGNRAVIYNSYTEKTIVVPKTDLFI